MLQSVNSAGAKSLGTGCPSSIKFVAAILLKLLL